MLIPVELFNFVLSILFAINTSASLLFYHPSAREFRKLYGSLPKRVDIRSFLKGVWYQVEF